VTRLADDRFRVVTGAGAVDSDRGFLELKGATVTDVTDDYAVIGFWGPEARAALAAITEEDVSNEAFPFRTAKQLEFGLAQRITYVGELGYELYVPRDGAVAVWDALMEAEPVPVGYQALDALRIEKGYRYFGSDLTPADTPYEGGVGFCVAEDKAFIGSMNLDPRSHNLNTEDGVLVTSAGIARTLADTFALATDPSVTYQVKLKSGSTSTVYWETKENGETVLYDDAPLTSGWRRFKAGFTRVLPIEGLL